MSAAPARSASLIWALRAGGLVTAALVYALLGGTDKVHLDRLRNGPLWIKTGPIRAQWHVARHRLSQHLLDAR